MTDLEISKALALAIGWKEHQLRLTYAFGVQVCTEAPRSCHTSVAWWRGFDYHDWNVIGPIAEKYNCFPHKVYGVQGKNWHVQWCAGKYVHLYADTPQKAIALAVIGAKK